MNATAHSLALLLLAGLPMLPSCTSTTADAPPLAATGEPAPPQSNWFQDTGDAAWNAVSSPVTGLIPKPRPKPAAVQLTPADPPEMVIITRENRGVVTEETPTTQP